MKDLRPDLQAYLMGMVDYARRHREGVEFMLTDAPEGPFYKANGEDGADLLQGLSMIDVASLKELGYSSGGRVGGTAKWQLTRKAFDAVDASRHPRWRNALSALSGDLFKEARSRIVVALLTFIVLFVAWTMGALDQVIQRITGG